MWADGFMGGTHTRSAQFKPMIELGQNEIRNDGERPGRRGHSPSNLGEYVVQRGV